MDHELRELDRAALAEIGAAANEAIGGEIVRSMWQTIYTVESIIARSKEQSCRVEGCT